MTRKESDFVEALTEVRVFLALETIFGIPWLIALPTLFFGFYTAAIAGLVTAIGFMVPSITALWMIHRNDERALIIAIQNFATPRTWLAGYGARKPIRIL